MEKNLFEDELGQTILMQTLLLAMPDLPKMYPKIKGLIEMIDKGITDYLGDDKMLALVKKNGFILLLVIDTKKQFTLTNKIVLEAPHGVEDPVINKFEKSEMINKVLNSAAFNILKERYEKLSPDEIQINPDNPLSHIVNNLHIEK